MTATDRSRRTLFHRLTGLAALLLFAFFMGGIVLAKVAMMGGFTVSRLPAQVEFMLLLASTFLGIVFLISEEALKNEKIQHAESRFDDLKPEEERR